MREIGKPLEVKAMARLFGGAGGGGSSSGPSQTGGANEPIPLPDGDE